VSTKTEAHRFAAERGRTVAADGRWWRWVVASLEPLDMRELLTIRLLVDAGVLVVCAGGGIPTVAGAIIARSF
jgi:carbamate kinase